MGFSGPLTVPTADGSANLTVRDVVGNKEDVASDTADVVSLMGVLRKTLFEAHESERHLHNTERWFGPAAAASGEDHVADPLGEVGGTPAGVITSFRATSGANKTWGTAVQIWGADDYLLMPAGKQAYQDAHRLLPTNAEVDKDTWLLRISIGNSAASAVSDDDYLTLPLFIEATDKAQTPVELITDRAPAGAKIWMELLHVDNDDAKYVDLQFGIHGYPE